MMSFWVHDRMGSAHVDPNEGIIDAVLSELDEPLDPEHPDVGLTHESEWSLGAFPSGLVVWENVADESGLPRHLRDVPRSKLREPWLALASGDIDRVNAEAWLPGYG